VSSIERGCAPILLFAYKRAEHLRRCVESLARNSEAAHSALYVYCDGPKSAADAAAVDEVRAFVAGISGFASVTPHLRETNVGLARSIVTGVGEQLRAHDRVIVVEDDLVLSPHFLRYMNDALDMYAADERVASVHGYCYPVRGRLPETFFLRGADCWGWATWRRAWARYSGDGQALLAQLRQQGLTKEFDLDGAYPFTRMLEDQIAGRNDSWAILWHASCFLSDMLTLYPGRSLVCNIGNDASGTHSKSTVEYAVQVAQEPVRVERLPIAPVYEARREIARFLRPSLVRRAIRAIAGLRVRSAGAS
jgi:hypothetical protein